MSDSESTEPRRISYISRIPRSNYYYLTQGSGYASAEYTYPLEDTTAKGMVISDPHRETVETSASKGKYWSPNAIQ
ncbi:MAG: hypothetical protein ACM3PP_01940 [Candidatus Saccharibacteria bacterium]